MNLPPQTQAILLLTAHFSKLLPDDVKPLTPTEWGRFALWLKEAGMRPEFLLSENLAQSLSGWSDKRITVDRVGRLLDRGSALAIAAEKWFRSGLWVLARFDANYPLLLKKRLKEISPPILFGCGNSRLLSQGGIAVVGSRNASEEDLVYAEQLGISAAESGASVISGGARGVDQAAMMGALNSEGTVIGVLADGLLRACSSQKYRRHLAENDLVLVSASYPDAGFSVGNAMGRNKYIYCLSGAAVVVHSGTRGGTITGALENIKNNWVPIWVKPTKDTAAGNSAIVDQGGQWIAASGNDVDVSGILESKAPPTPLPDDTDIFQALRPDSATYAIGVEKGSRRESVDENRSNYAVTRIVDESVTSGMLEDSDFYEIFLTKLKKEIGNGEFTRVEIGDALQIKKAQLDEWLNRAVDDSRIVKKTRPVRYQWQERDPQITLFDD